MKPHDRIDTSYTCTLPMVEQSGESFKWKSFIIITTPSSSYVTGCDIGRDGKSLANICSINCTASYMCKRRM